MDDPILPSPPNTYSISWPRGLYLQAPVVYAGADNHFSGFGPDRFKALANLTAS